MRLSQSPGCRAALPIHSVSRLTNLSVDTIRAWEKRYGAVKPARTAGGKRLFSPDDVARLVLLKAAVQSGQSISRIAPLSDMQLQQVVQSEQLVGDTDDAAIERLLRRVRAMDARGLAHDLCACALSRGAVEFADDVIAPLVSEIVRGARDADERAEQRLLLQESMRFVAATLFGKYEQPSAAAVMLFVTLPGEKHSIPPLLGALVASEFGYQGIFAGTEISAHQTIRLTHTLSACGVGIYAGVERDDTPRVVGSIAAALPALPLFVGGAGMRRVKGVQVSESMRQFAAALARGVKRPTEGSPQVATA
ncbi:MAG TPA: MerR family transcriptional regulator [Verrucomicrobiae bacterium]|nr:MerR family transcriptional regulator [Verrucomicrobiae bacterium]